MVESEAGLFYVRSVQMLDDPNDKKVTHHTIYSDHFKLSNNSESNLNRVEEICGKCKDLQIVISNAVSKTNSSQNSCVHCSIYENQTLILVDDPDTFSVNGVFCPLANSGLLVEKE